VIPFWGIRCYCNNCCCHLSETERKVVDNQAAIFYRSQRVFAWQSILIDLPIFVINLYLNRDSLTPVNLVSAFISGCFFLYSFAIVAEKPIYSSWTRTRSEIARDTAAERKKEQDRIDARRRARERAAARNRVLSPLAFIAALVLFGVALQTEAIGFVVAGMLLFAWSFLRICELYVCSSQKVVRVRVEERGDNFEYENEDGRVMSSECFEGGDERAQARAARPAAPRSHALRARRAVPVPDLNLQMVGIKAYAEPAFVAVPVDASSGPYAVASHNHESLSASASGQPLAPNSYGVHSPPLLVAPPQPQPQQ
jgi:hypothetical protein